VETNKKREALSGLEILRNDERETVLSLLDVEELQIPEIIFEIKDLRACSRGHERRSHPDERGSSGKSATSLEMRRETKIKFARRAF
jgi:hypothetical protein